MGSSATQKRLISKINSVYQKALDDGFMDAKVLEILLASNLKKHVENDASMRRTRSRFFCCSVSVAVIAMMATTYYMTLDPRCIIANNLVLQELARPAVSCDVCKDMFQVPTVNGDTFTREEFLKDYAYNGIPLLVKGGANNWTALQVFSYNYLKDLFVNTEGALEAVEFDCQFFPYKTKFLTLAEVFAMSEAQSRIDEGEEQWYVGWSNCNPDVTKQLRKHYKRPEFLPDNSESSNLDWLFMGGFGGGANVHIDYVQRPSWQAMIAGKKSWSLIPSPECDSVCKPLNATMEKGDIILVDTNMWYHSTYIHPGEVSITIGSEYD